MKRVICLMLALLMLLTILAACAKADEDQQPIDETVSTALSDEEIPREQIPDNLPERDYDGRQFNILVQTYNAALDDFVVGEESTSPIDQEVHKRNLKVQERFNVTLEFYQSDYKELNEKIAVSVSSGDGTYDLAAQHIVRSVGAIEQGLLNAWNDMEYIDVERPWWNKSAWDEFGINGQSMLLVGDIAQVYIESCYGIIFNKRLEAEIVGKDSLFEYVKNGSWTWEQFYTILENHYIDDGDVPGEKDKNDEYGCVFQAKNYQNGFQFGFGLKTTFIDTDGFPTLDVDVSKFSDVSEKITKLINQTPGSFTVNDWNTHKDVFRAGNALFMPGVFTLILRDIKDMSDEYGILPMPKYDEEQSEYYSFCDGAASAMICPIDVKDKEMVGIITEALAAESWKFITPETVESALSARYAFDDNQGVAVQMILDGVYFDFGVTYESAPVLYKFCNATKQEGFASYLQTNKDAWERKLSDLAWNITHPGEVQQ